MAFFNARLTKLLHAGRVFCEILFGIKIKKLYKRFLGQATSQVQVSLHCIMHENARALTQQNRVISDQSVCFNTYTKKPIRII